MLHLILLFDKILRSIYCPQFSQVSSQLLPSTSIVNFQGTENVLYRRVWSWLKIQLEALQLLI